MKRKFEIKTIQEIRHPALLVGALESMGFWVDDSSNGSAGSGTPDNGFDVRIEDSEGHVIRGLNIEKWFASRKTPE